MFPSRRACPAAQAWPRPSIQVPPRSPFPPPKPSRSTPRPRQSVSAPARRMPGARAIPLFWGARDRAAAPGLRVPPAAFPPPRRRPPGVPGSAPVYRATGPCSGAADQASTFGLQALQSMSTPPLRADCHQGRAARGPPGNSPAADCLAAAAFAERRPPAGRVPTPYGVSRSRHPTSG